MSNILESAKAAMSSLGALIAAFEEQSPRRTLIPAIDIELKPGEHYAGVCMGEGGAPTHHLILLAGQAADITWDNAMAWAAKLGGDLPTRAEQALLFANLKGQFEPRWHWSNEQHAASPSYAWNQNFSYGDQGIILKSYGGRARAVRRVAI